jgi:hypothetical protein
MNLTPKAEMTLEERPTTWDKRLKDLVLYFIGCAGVINELWFEDQPRPPVLFFLITVLGLPLVQKADEKRRGDGG